MEKINFHEKRRLKIKLKKGTFEKKELCFSDAEKDGCSRPERKGPIQV
jgi:hypothetical protein